MTPTDSWKAKRIAKNPHVTLALCTFRGEVLSPTVMGTAQHLSGEEARHARALLRTNILGWVWNIIFSLRYPGDKTAVYEVSLVAEEQTAEEGDMKMSG